MSAKKPVLIIVAGPNGSGKTTVTSKILRHQWLEDSVYSVENGEAQLLIRYADGCVAKRYCASLPEWAKQITE